MKKLEVIPVQSFEAMQEVAEPKEVEHYLVAEMFCALGLQFENTRLAWLKPIFGRLVRGFAQKAAAFDESVSRLGLQASAQEWLSKWVPGINMRGKEKLPSNGPMLIAANHPGTYDGLAVASALPRQDLKIVASGNPFFRSLPNTRQHFIYATRDMGVRITTIRHALRHLQAGGSLLIFPSGKVDPDPFYFKQEARKALDRWSDSLELILRKVPQTKLVVAINSGFVAPEFLRHPLLYLQTNLEKRQKLAEFWQVVRQVIYEYRVSILPGIAFSEPLSLAELSENAKGFRAQLTAWASQLIEVDTVSNAT